MTILLSILPVTILLGYIYWQDKFEREPLGQLAKAFAGGVLALVCAIIVATPLDQVVICNPFLQGLYSAFITAAIPEEGFKFLFLYLFIWKSREFNEYFDGIVYAVFVSLGFACVENIMYVWQYGTEIAFQRGLFAVPAHFLFGVVMGYYFSLAKFRKQSNYLLLVVVGAVIFHGTYNTLLFWSDTVAEVAPEVWVLIYLIFLGFDVLLWRHGIRNIKHLVKMRICPECNTHYNNNEIYCQNCGTKI